MDFYLQDHLESAVAAAAANDVSGLLQWEKFGCELIRNTIGIFERVRESVMRRAASYLETKRQHFEHFV
jgi:hypothetical protein